MIMLPLNVAGVDMHISPRNCGQLVRLNTGVVQIEQRKIAEYIFRVMQNPFGNVLRDE